MSRVFRDDEKKRIWNTLKEIALEDGIFSQEEQELMAHIIMDLEQYTRLMEEALKDGIIDDLEEHELFDGRMQILEKAYAKAREDSKITKDEREILKEICRVIRQMND